MELQIYTESQHVRDILDGIGPGSLASDNGTELSKVEGCV